MPKSKSRYKHYFDMIYLCDSSALQNFYHYPPCRSCNQVPIMQSPLPQKIDQPVKCYRMLCPECFDERGLEANSTGWGISQTEIEMEWRLQNYGK